jgi:ATP-dependent Clp protease ATP-binding subunit ClpA
MLQILARRTRNSVVLIGEAGVAKDALVRGLTQRIADSNVPQALAERLFLQLHVLKLATARLSGFPILYIRGLLDSRLPLRA